jgi:hypothetical protein
MIPLPMHNLKLKKYGNIIRGRNKITLLLREKNVFQGTIDGVSGTWKRQKRLRRSGGSYGRTGAILSMHSIRDNFNRTEVEELLFN